MNFFIDKSGLTANTYSGTVYKDELGMEGHATVAEQQIRNGSFNNLSEVKLVMQRAHTPPKCAKQWKFT